MATDRFRITMEFSNGTTHTFNAGEPMSSDWLRAGEWDFPFSSTVEDPVIFGLVELYYMSNPAVSAVLWANGEPDKVKIEALP